MERVTEYMYYVASAGDVRSISMRLLALRINAFGKVHNQEMKNRIILAGGKPK